MYTGHPEYRKAIHLISLHLNDLNDLLFSDVTGFNNVLVSWVIVIVKVLIRLARFPLSLAFLPFGLLLISQGKRENKHKIFVVHDKYINYCVTAENYPHPGTSKQKVQSKQRETETCREQHWWAEGSDWGEQYWRHLRVIAPRAGESDGEEAGEGFCSMEKYIFYKAAL